MTRTITPAGYIVTDRHSISIWASGATKASAWANFIAGMAAANISVAAEMPDDPDARDGIAAACDYTLMPASAPLIQMVEDRGGATNWSESRGGIACTTAESDRES